MEVRYANIDDKQEIVKLWKQMKNDFSIPFNKEIDCIINEKRFFVVKEDNELIAMGGFQIMKRHPQIKVKHICTKENYRNKGIAMNILKRIINETKEIDYELTCDCRDGANNNAFYDKIRLDFYVEKRDTINIRHYLLDKNKIINYRKEK